MGLGRRAEERQQAFWVSADSLGQGPQNVFYDQLNQLLTEIGFARKLEAAVEPFYETTGRKGLPPGVYFRMFSIGYFEDISSQRGIAGRCEDSRLLARFLGYGLVGDTPDHSTLSATPKRLPLEVHYLAFKLVLLGAAKDHGLLKGKTIGVDAIDLEANASMKSIVRRDDGDNYQEYLRNRCEEKDSKSESHDDELRRFDKRWKNKTISNEEWVSRTDDDALAGNQLAAK